jgi:hypothetical protein
MEYAEFYGVNNNDNTSYARLGDDFPSFNILNNQDDSVCDDNFMRYVGFKEDNECIKKYFSKTTVRIISRKVTELTMGVDPQNRPIVVPEKNICSVMSQIYQAFRPAVGSIYSRYIVPTDEPDSYVQNMIDQVIEIIVSDIRNNLGIEQHNATLTAWTTVLGDFNTQGLRSHSIIKIRERNTSHRGVVTFLNY